MSKIHFKYQPMFAVYPTCHKDADFERFLVASFTDDPAKVTCGRCRNTKAWKEAMGKEEKKLLICEKASGCTFGGVCSHKKAHIVKPFCISLSCSAVNGPVECIPYVEPVKETTPKLTVEKVANKDCTNCKSSMEHNKTDTWCQHSLYCNNGNQWTPRAEPIEPAPSEEKNCDESCELYNHGRGEHQCLICPSHPQRQRDAPVSETSTTSPAHDTQERVDSFKLATAPCRVACHECGDTIEDDHYIKGKGGNTCKECVLRMSELLGLIYYPD
jgi:hypothetical protein